MALSNAQINARKDDRVADHQRNIQANGYFPIQIAVGTEITLGRAILDAIQARPALAAAVGYQANDEAGFLDRIEAVAFPTPVANITIKAYTGATVDSRIAAAGVTTYLPCAALYKNYIQGTGNEVVDVFI